MNTYQEFTIKPSDTVSERINKLYMGIISVGEDLYCKGAYLSEIEKQVAQMRRELADIKREIKIERRG